jgi:hypothetical protein
MPKRTKQEKRLAFERVQSAIDRTSRAVEGANDAGRAMVTLPTEDVGRVLGALYSLIAPDKLVNLDTGELLPQMPEEGSDEARAEGEPYALEFVAGGPSDEYKRRLTHYAGLGLAAKAYERTLTAEGLALHGHLVVARRRPREDR